MNRVSIITPTGDRFESLKLLCRFLMEQQTRGDLLIEWVVVDDGVSNDSARALSVVGESTLANYGISVYYLRRKHVQEDVGPKSLAKNVLHGLSVISAPKLLIMEDDDCYRAWYLQDMLDRLDSAQLVGTTWQKYYHLPSMSYRTFKNRGSAFCSTGMRADVIPLLKDACQQGLLGHKGIDAKLWALAGQNGLSLDCFTPSADAVIGMKGLPGRHGIGVGHAPKGFTPDPTGRVLSEWCGFYADEYLRIKKEYLL